MSPYSDQFGGCVLNATIDMYAHCTIEMHGGSQVEFIAKDIDTSFKDEARPYYDLDNNLTLHKAIYNRVIADYNKGEPLPVKVITYSDAPPGSGLGSSSTMVVTILSAYQQLLNIPLGEYDLAHLAYEIERIDCGMSGGKQDQYATTFGGFNFMEFYANDKVIVNPLRIRASIVNELEAQLLLYFTGVSRDSAKIIDDQVHSTSSDKKTSLQSMHDVRRYAIEIKEKLLRSDIDGVSDVFDLAWEAKKRTSSLITNPYIEEIYTVSKRAGAKSLKISGAGGGGFMMLFVEPTKKLDVINALEPFDGYFARFQFTNRGTEAWTV